METQIQETIWNEVSRAGMRRMKEWLKAEGPNIRKTKLEFKEKQRTGKDVYKDHSNLWEMRNSYRHRHIAYSELRGRERDQIEKPADDNLPNEKRISEIKEEILGGLLDKSKLKKK